MIMGILGNGVEYGFGGNLLLWHVTYMDVGKEREHGAEALGFIKNIHPNLRAAITVPNGEQVNFLFDAGSRLQETNLPNGVSARYQYDAGNKLIRLVNRTRQGIISQHDYGYDSVGRRKSHTETIAGITSLWERGQFSHCN